MSQEMCEACGTVFDEEDLNDDGLCPDCVTWYSDIETAEDEEN